MKRERLIDNEKAVSEIVGELLVLFITVAIFGLLITVVNGMINRPHTDIVSIGAANNTTTVTLTHMGGDNVDYRYISVIVNGHAAAYARSDDNGNGLWDLGETLLAANPPAGQGLDVLVYDSASSATLGDFRLR
jgi:archaeal type IV pilus assembly protein PilA